MNIPYTTKSGATPMPYHHISAMLSESINFLNCAPGKIIIDGTIGSFGHASIICKKIKPGGTLIGLDQDIDAIENSKKIIKKESIQVYIRHNNFVNINKVLKEIDIPSVDGILIDLGLSLHQIQASGRGFSFLRDEPLDMRMNSKSDITASDILETFTEKKLTNIFTKYGEERWSKKIAHHLVKNRNTTPITTTKQLVKLVKEVIPQKYTRTKKIHPATKVFMALRIAVNQELDILDQFLKNVMNLLKPKGRLCVLSFHSLEDRIVKNRFKTFERPCTCPSDFPICICNLYPVAKVITKKVVKPSKKEIKTNPMARSTRLRVIEKI